MEKYDLDLAGLRAQLRTPHKITISENLRPFLCREHLETDCTISLQCCDCLPAFSQSGVWHGLQYFDSVGEAVRVFHCTDSNRTPFAVTQLFENGNVEILILPDYLSYFSGTEGIFNRIGMETMLLQHGGLLLHASLIKYGENAIAFAGPSGVGKSTHANLWCTYLGARLINGDRAVLRNTPEGWMAYGSPYAGTSGIYKKDQAPLAAIVLLAQAGENRLRQLNGGEAFRYIYPELSVHRWEKAFVAKATDLCLQLIADVPVYLLECRPDEDAALLVKRGLML